MSKAGNILRLIPPGIKDNIPFFLKVKDYYHYKQYKNYEYEKIIKKLHNSHKGERCFVVATGPSISKTNLDLIKDEILFGVNTLYKGYNKFNINCQYYGVSDPDVLKEEYKNVLPLDTTLFLSGAAGKEYLNRKVFYQKYQKNEPIVIRDLGEMWSVNCFSKDLSRGTYWTHTITCDICLPAAYYMGFKEVYLVGCDCGTSGGQHFYEKTKDNIDDAWRFHTNYKKKRMLSIFDVYEVCKRHFEEDGKKIINCTVGGKLGVFERKKLEEVV